MLEHGADPISHGAQNAITDVVVFINGGALGTDWIAKNSPAVVEAFYPVRDFDHESALIYKHVLFALIDAAIAGLATKLLCNNEGGTLC